MADSELSPEHKIRKQKKLNFLYISIIAHILLGLLAAYVIIQVITPRPPPKFVAAPPSQMAVHPDEHKVQQQKRNSTMSAPQMKRITANVASQISLPPMPSTPAITASMGGGNSMGAGFGSGFGTGTGVGGGGVHAFGLRTGVGLKGTFYDFKQTMAGQPTDMSGGSDDHKAVAKFAQIMTTFSLTFNESAFANYYRAPDALYNPFIFYPYIPSEAAPKEFGVGDKVKPALWCVVYKGSVTPPIGGTYRFVGFGDDVCIVRFNGKTVLNHGTFSWKGSPTNGMFNNPSSEWNPKNPNFKSYLYTRMVNSSDGSFYKAMHGHLAGLPVTVTAGMSYPIEIVIGDWGGLTEAQVLIEKEGVEYQKDPGGSPILPIFCVSKGGGVKLPADSNKAPPFDHNPPAWSIWKLNEQSAFFGGM